MSETNIFIEIPEIIQLLHYEKTSNPERNTKNWLLKRGIKQFRRGLYIRETVINALNSEVEKFLQQEKKATLSMSGVRYEWENKQSKSPNNLQDLLKQKMRRSISAN